MYLMCLHHFSVLLVSASRIVGLSHFRIPNVWQNETRERHAQPNKCVWSYWIVQDEQVDWKSRGRLLKIVQSSLGIRILRNYDSWSCEGFEQVLSRSSPAKPNPAKPWKQSKSGKSTNICARPVRGPLVVSPKITKLWCSRNFYKQLRDPVI